MTRLSTSTLSNAFLLGIASFALQTQSMASDLPEWRWQGTGNRRLHGLSPDQPDHAQFRVYRRGLEGTHQHDDRPVRQSTATERDRAVPG